MWTSLLRYRLDCKDNYEKSWLVVNHKDNNVFFTINVDCKLICFWKFGTSACVTSHIIMVIVNISLKLICLSVLSLLFCFCCCPSGSDCWLTCCVVFISFFDFKEKSLIDWSRLRHRSTLYKCLLNNLQLRLIS